MASKIVEAVRNSPLIGKRGGYSPITTHNADPFVQGIPFHALFLASVEVQDRVGTDKVHDTVNKALDLIQRDKRSPIKVTIMIKAISISVSNSKVETTYPIYLISYCGNARDADVVFFFIHKNKETQKIMAEVFKCSSEEKVVAITRTISKAFHIAYKAWQTKKRLQQRQNSPRSSPLLQQKTAKERDTANLGKTAVEKAAGATGSYYTPPIPRKSPEKVGERPRSGSMDDEEAAKVMSQLKVSALDKVKIKNETSGRIKINVTCSTYMYMQL